MDRFKSELKRLSEGIGDMARIGGHEAKILVDKAKVQMEKMHLIQKRKELFSELGRALYDARKDGLPVQVEEFLVETEFEEIMNEIQQVDAELEKRS